MKQGFTLIEVLVVASIIGILSTIGMVSYRYIIGHSRYSKSLADMNNILTAAQLYYQSTNAYPIDIAPGSHPDMVPVYMPVWPNPPCPNMIYDWEYWVPPVSAGEIVRVTLRKNPSYDVVYYLCLSTKTSACQPPWPGLDAKTMSPKTLDCN